jgi:probable HAF family extracellular repeat protein
VELLEDRKLLSYTVTELGSLGGSQALPLALNNRDAVVGVSLTTNNLAKHAFLFQHGKLTDLGTLGGTDSRAMGINDRGTIVGVSQVSGGNTQYELFVYQHGKFTDLGSGYSESVLGGVASINNQGTISGFSESNSDAAIERRGKLIDLGSLAGLGSAAQALNSKNEVVGFSQVIPGAGGSIHAFLYNGHKMTDLGTLGGSNSQANGLNDRGSVVGISSTAGNVAAHAFVYQHGHMYDLGTLGGFLDSSAGAINNHGVIVGAAMTPASGPPHGFVEMHGKMIDLNTLIPANSGIVITIAQDINDRGQIAAQAYEVNSPSTSVAVLLTPKRGSR